MEIDFIKIIEETNPNLLVFLLTTLIGLLAWIVKGLIDNPLKASKDTFDKFSQLRIEILSIIRNRMMHIYYLADTIDKEEVSKYKNELQNFLLLEGKNGYISKDIIEEVMRITFTEETNKESALLTINKLNEELGVVVDNVKDELDFFSFFSHKNPWKRIVSMYILIFQYLLFFTLSFIGLFFVFSTIVYGSLIIKVLMFFGVILTLIIANLWLKNKFNKEFLKKYWNT